VSHRCASLTHSTSYLMTHRHFSRKPSIILTKEYPTQTSKTHLGGILFRQDDRYYGISPMIGIRMKRGR
jgi:hypothetical protein